jgi:hypothetical protein
MKSSTFLRSFGSIQSSALNVPFRPFPRGTSQAYFVATRSASKRVIKSAPDSPLRMRDQVSSTPLARGDIIPKPVITTRRMLYPFQLIMFANSLQGTFWASIEK